MAVYTAHRRDTCPLAVLTPGRTFGRGTPALFPPGATLKALTHCEVWFVEPAVPQAKADTGAPARRAPRRTAPWARLALLLLILLATAVVLALPAARAGLALAPMGLGEWCIQQGKTWCAREAWAAAQYLAPRNATPALALGMLAFREGDLDAAERAFEHARAVDAAAPAAHNNLGVVYHRRGEYGRAAAAFEQALALEPGRASVEKNLGDSLLALKEYDEAIGHYQVALGLAGPWAEMLANMAIAQYQAGEPAEAEITLQRALAHALDEGVRSQIGRSLAALEAAAPDEVSP